MKKIMLGLLLSLVSSLLVAQNRFLINLEGQKFDSPLAQYYFEGLLSRFRTSTLTLTETTRAPAQQPYDTI